VPALSIITPPTGLPPLCRTVTAQGVVRYQVFRSDGRGRLEAKTPAAQNCGRLLSRSQSFYFVGASYALFDHAPREAVRHPAGTTGPKPSRLGEQARLDGGRTIIPLTRHGAGGDRRGVAIILAVAVMPRPIPAVVPAIMPTFTPVNLLKRR
jgi:hypothetical protein